MQKMHLFFFIVVETGWIVVTDLLVVLGFRNDYNALEITMTVCQ